MFDVRRCGNGKSASVRKLAYRLWQIYTPGQRLPLWIPLEEIENPWEQLIQKYLKKALGVEIPDAVLQNIKWCLLLDGYDELSKKENLYNSKRWNKLDVKVIISCRTQAVVGVIDNYKKKFVPNDFTRDNDLWNQLTQIVLHPFNEAQRNAYIAAWCKTNEIELRDGRKTVDPYLAGISKIKGLSELVQNPFLLQTILQIFPRLLSVPTQEISRLDVLSIYVNDHFEQEINKLSRQQPVSSLSSLSSQDVYLPGMIEYSQQLALMMFLELSENKASQFGVNKIRWKIGDDQNPWRIFFEVGKYQNWQQKSCMLYEKAEVIINELKKNTRITLCRLFIQT